MRLGKYGGRESIGRGGKHSSIEKKAKQREQKEEELEEEHRGKGCLQREPAVSTQEPAVTYHQQ